MERFYDPSDWRNRVVRWKKYLIPWGCATPFSPTQSAPRNFMHLDQQVGAALPSASATFQAFEICKSPSFQQCSVPMIQNGVWSDVALAAIPSHRQLLYQFPNGLCVGRSSCLVDRDGNAVFETAFLHKFGVSGPRKFLRFDPRHRQHRRRGNLTARSRIPAPQRLNGIAIALNNCSSHNFFHWLTEVAPKVMGARLANIQADYYIVDHQSDYQRWILEALGTKPSQWIQPHCNLCLQPDQLLWCDHPSSTLVKAYASEVKRSLEEGRISSTVQDQFEEIKLYISRESAGHRKFHEEGELVGALKKVGFQVYDFAKIPISKQIALVAKASHIVSIHGAALAHLLFAEQGARVVEIMPQGRTNLNLFPSFSRHFGLRHAIVMADCSRHGQRLRVNVDDVMSAIHRLDLSSAS